MNRMAIHYFATESIVNGLRRDVERPKLAEFCPMPLPVVSSNGNTTGNIAQPRADSISRRRAISVHST
jgi:hypothetical protein